MAVGFRGVATATGNGSASTNTTTTVTPGMPAGVISGDLVAVCLISTGTVAAPTNWTPLLASTSLGGGAVANTTGPRQHTIHYREYDGAWSMPVFTCAAVAAVGPGIWAMPIAFSRAVGEQFLLAVGSGSDSTSGTGYSVVTGSFADPTGALAWLCLGWPINPGTLSALGLTAPGLTIASNTNRHGVNGNTVGFDVLGSTWTFPVTVGGTAVHTAAVTGTVASTCGGVVASVSVITPPKTIPRNRARFHAANW